MRAYTYSDLMWRLTVLQDDLGDLDDIASHLSLSDEDAVHFSCAIQRLIADVEELSDRAVRYED